MNTQTPLDPSKEVETTKTDVIEYNITDAAIEIMKSDFMPLKVIDVEDKKGFGLVVEARKKVQAKIKAVEETRVMLKHDSLERGRKIDAEAKRITAKLSPIKEHLKSQEDIIKKEKERIAEEKREAVEQLHRNRIKALIDAGSMFNGIGYDYAETMFTDNEVRVMNDEHYDFLLDKVKAWKKEKDFKEAETARLKKEEAERQAKIAADNKKRQDELDAREAKQAAEAKKIKDAQDKLAADKKAEEDRKAKEIADKKHAEEIEAAKKKAAEEAKKKAEEEAKRKAREEKEAEERKQAEIEAKKRRQPDKKKLQDFHNEMISFWEDQEPELKTKKAGDVLRQAKQSFFANVEDLHENLNKL